GELLAKLWTEVMPNTEFPFDQIKLDLEQVMVTMKDSKDKDLSVVMFNVIIDWAKLGVYFIKQQAENEAVTVFTIQPKAGILIDNLPGVNTRLPNPIDTNFKFIISSGAVSFTLNQTAYQFQKGFTINCELDIPEVIQEEFTYHYSTTSTEAAEDAVTSRSTDLAPQPDTVATATKVKWFEVNKKIASVATIHRIGLAFQDKKLALLFDLDANFSVIQMSLIGLRLNLDLNYISYFKDFGKQEDKVGQLKKFVKDAISLHLDGLGVGLETSALTVAGVLARQEITINGVAYDQYIGALTVKTNAFTASALGAYGEIEGYKSFLLYAFLGVPIGGPPFFFVDGLALGFGFNRQVILPPLNQLADFPLIRIVMNTPDPEESFLSQVTKMVPMMVEAFPPMKNHLFFAVGVRFNSFKLIDGFLLLIVTLGEKVRIDLLGLAMLVMPKEKPVVVVELVVRATVIPADGILQIEGMITENSYIFSKDARLQGGFALYAWTKNIGSGSQKIYAGDFVMTIGGYHPMYTKPSHYPDMPRFGLNWQVNQELTIKAEAYFAMTPAAIMAGGEMSASYKSKKLKASFIVWANFFIQWKPFSYYVAAGIDIKVSYQTFIKTFNFSLGVNVEIWGPEFSGKVKIDCKIVTFTIRFGKADKPEQKTISWLAFVEGFLPAANEVISLNTLAGLVKEVDGKAIVNPKDFNLKVESTIPISSIQGIAAASSLNSFPFGIYPVVRGKSTSSMLSILIQEKGSDDDQIINNFKLKPIYTHVPAALWSQQGTLDLKTKERTIPALKGFELQLKPPKEGKNRSVYQEPEYQDHVWEPTGMAEAKQFIPETHFGLFKEAFLEELTSFSEEAYGLKGGVETENNL
ncbi:MAG: DUF6603 domain-containing protein, partial [Flammeovirgaceae bacterium]